MSQWDVWDGSVEWQVTLRQRDCMNMDTDEKKVACESVWTWTVETIIVAYLSKFVAMTHPPLPLLWLSGSSSSGLLKELSESTRAFSQTKVPIMHFPQGHLCTGVIFGELRLAIVNIWDEVSASVTNDDHRTHCNETCCFVVHGTIAGMITSSTNKRHSFQMWLFQVATDTLLAWHRNCTKPRTKCAPNVADCDKTWKVREMLGKYRACQKTSSSYGSWRKE